MHAGGGGGGAGGGVPPRPTATSAPEGSSSRPGGDEDAMWQMGMRGGEQVDAGSYPERPGEPDCSFYMRTGTCRFGMTCKFNHPPNRALVMATARLKGEYPQRVGQPECQYYLKTGTCKFGATCKFHHPREKAGIAGRVQLNILGYPLRPDEKECAYYSRTGQCKFGGTCKFHHPQPSNTMVALRGGASSSIYSPQAVTSPVYAARASFITSPRWQGPSSYAQVILPQGLVQVPGWNPYPAPLGSPSPDDPQRNTATAQYYTTSRQSDVPTDQGVYSSYQPGSVLYAVHRENIFPERPDQPECQFYMKTGDCKFGATCKFHHPRERLVPAPNCALSPIGLPLRPGEPICDFYSRYGICKFGPNCKFDHPMGPYMYGLAASPQQIPATDRSNEREASQSSS
ncbi:hypothetical protein LUZ61_005283 [Rhynchospora tenuis]|uniref:C3H1-type domain-containing protein n=1 Tax=Rhynchospora tenuis TaxID=198213 RepID=A0AAD6EUG9_9POAL|nr:hypothetical protein LUZ61_005283 [Rhynchospora tenuis]